MKKYFYLIGEDKKGPFSFEEMKNEDINSDTLIWFQGIENWTAAKYILEIKEILEIKPPPIQRNNDKGNREKNQPIIPFFYHLGFNIVLNIGIIVYVTLNTIKQFNQGYYPNPHYDVVSVVSITSIAIYYIIAGILFPLFIAFILRLFNKNIFKRSLIVALYIMQVNLLLAVHGMNLRQKRLQNTLNSEKEHIINQNYKLTPNYSKCSESINKDVFMFDI